MGLFSRKKKASAESSEAANPVPPESASALIVDNAELQRRGMEAAMKTEDFDPLAMAINMNANVLELGVSPESPEAQDDREGEFMIFLVDEDGFVLSQDGEYLLPEDVRRNNTWARLKAK